MLTFQIHINQPFTERDAQMLIAMGDTMSAIFADAKNPDAAPKPQPETPITETAQQPAAVNTHTMPQQPVTPPVAPVASITAPVAPVASAPVAPPAAVPTTTPDYTHEQLGRAAAAYLDANPAGRAQLVGLLQQFGVSSLQQLATPETRTAFANAMRQLGVQV